MTKEPILTARGLVKRYGRVTALDQADFDLYPGEILAVIGDNGAGKSSLIKAISGAVSPDEGEIKLDGKPMSIRDKGPLMLVYPFDLDADLYNEKYFSRSVWQIKEIEVGQ